MPNIEPTPSDLSRARSLDADESFPTDVVVLLRWIDPVSGRFKVRNVFIKADQFFGRGTYGAPITGEWIIQAIERLRREGPPKRQPRAKPKIKDTSKRAMRR